MTSLSYIVPNIYGETVLRDHALGFIEQSLEAIDLNQNVINKIALVIKKSPFIKKIEGEQCRYVCYQEIGEAREHKWQKLPDRPTVQSEDLPIIALPLLATAAASAQPVYAPLKEECDEEYAQFVGAQKQFVTAVVCNDLEESWAELAAQVDKFKHHGPLAIVEGEVAFEVDTMDKESKAPNPTRQFKFVFEIGDQTVCSE